MPFPPGYDIVSTAFVVLHPEAIAKYSLPSLWWLMGMIDWLINGHNYINTIWTWCIMCFIWAHGFLPFKHITLQQNYQLETTLLTLHQTAKESLKPFGFSNFQLLFDLYFGTILQPGLATLFRPSHSMQDVIGSLQCDKKLKNNLISLLRPFHLIIGAYM